MKVLHVISCLVEADGHALFCRRLASELQRKSIVNRILTCPHVNDQPIFSPVHPDVEMHVSEGRVRCVLQIAWVRGLRQFVAREMEQFAPDLVHVHGLWHPIVHAGVRAAVRRRLPVVTSVHGMLMPFALRHHVWRKRLAWFLYQRRDLQKAQVLHATAAIEAGALRQLGLRNPIAIVPLGMDVPELEPMAKKSASHVRTILFLSRIHSEKGLLNLVDAWAKVRRPGWRIRIAGPDEGGHQSHVARHAEACGVAEDFDFSGPLYGAAKEHAYREAEVFVLPSRSESFGVVVLEALACGVPVIATRAAPWAELEGGVDGVQMTLDGGRCGVTPSDRALITGQPSNTGRCGWWVDVGVAPLAAALQEAMELDDATRREMGARGRELVCRRYTWPSVADQMAAAYTSATKGV